ncbi:asparaginase [Brevibacillus fluminis]|uniref:Asparaginase n=1 Tax=Brevibacillus fluminis TaxID=511487 RepID=A0A3M8DHE1_9BACL|nr:asparaginase [Brevibacillus fluminis]RNB87019.1 asparaginase [Brevibacillus fluminis]
MVETLVVVKRGNQIESRHSGSIAVVDYEGNQLYAVGDVGRVTLTRSVLKPIQAIPVIQSGAADRFLFTDKEISICCGSHNGEQQHTKVVESMLFRLGLTEENLQCGVHAPYSQASYGELLRQGVEPTPIHNNCSGKHAGMLALALQLQSDISTYHHLEHPVQRKIEEALLALSGLKGDELVTEIDGCGVPTFGLPLHNLAHVYAQLAHPEKLDSLSLRTTVKRIVSSMMAYPEMVSGTDEFCTDVMRALPGKVLAKGGAEGVYCMGLPEKGIGIAIKIDDGAFRAAYPAAMEVLKQLGVLDAKEEEALLNYRKPPITNRRKEMVGVIEPVFALNE